MLLSRIECKDALPLSQPHNQSELLSVAHLPRSTQAPTKGRTLAKPPLGIAPPQLSYKIPKSIAPSPTQLQNPEVDRTHPQISHPQPQPAITIAVPADKPIVPLLLFNHFN